ncbi:alpha-tocopherol transfer protein-like isoform X1 [Stegodyphus dumicola]|uniref:alpha-tocopherol transfer protein-like isoform X1 n=1 Tax=Stegodyphus dumicola TaxID=202533 RepID=UPI0015ADE587|nr:alpha-tocopherol transfer protein-like isoform X1 [Stegodyphus dumicola]XP_035225597.1 alpha-tocopherol transfer protein-like isoform X1 [Stegodyphus dumicola]XP_035225598.1 alpha-tocopherol transfer protein-like isoform X1 [Stegodyphus dumicola]
MGSNIPTDVSAFIPLEFKFLTEQMIRKAEEELGETEKRRKECLEEFKNMIKREKNLNANTCDEFLLIFLRGKKFRLEAAFKVLKKYYLNRKTYSSLYQKFSPEHCREALLANFLNFLPLRTPEGESVWVPRIGSWDTKIFTPEEITRVGLICLEMEMKNPVTQICGMVVLLDLKGFSCSHMFQITSTSLMCFMNTVQDGLPLRLTALHVINNPSIFGAVFKTVKPLLNAKIKKRVYFHGNDLSSLHQFLPKEMLPEEFGGTQGPFGNARFYQSLLDNEEEYKKCQQYGYGVVRM